MFFRLPRLGYWIALYWLSLGLLSRASAAEQKYWEFSPYRVAIHLAEAPTPYPALDPGLREELEQKIRTTLYPLWSSTLHWETGAERAELLANIRRPAAELADCYDLDQLCRATDKRLLLALTATPVGLELTCRELDCTTRRWGSPQRRLVRQDGMLSAHCLDLLCQTFAPLATIRPVPDHPEQVVLQFRGSKLPQQTDLSVLTPVGLALQPLQVRTNTSGELEADSASAIPWTALTLERPTAAGWLGAVHAGTRRPFGVRRRGRIEHLALAIKHPSGSTQVRFYPRHDRQRSLSGYEVFQQTPGDSTPGLLGVTDRSGSIEVHAGTHPVALLLLRSEGQLLAKLPVVPGAQPLVEVPIADDIARLRAQAELTALSERLIDTVAQRNILIARVRDRIAQGALEEAQTLFSSLDDLPGRSDFSREINSVENRRRNQSQDSKVQARIEKLFADTRKLLGRFLSTKPISQLQGELTAARRASAS